MPELQAVIEKASIDEVYMDVTTMVEKELRVCSSMIHCGNRSFYVSSRGHDVARWGSLKVRCIAGSPCRPKETPKASP
jgi:nucleotidyltransferase/DNA polymerase involved in DNA repair